jgi:hypothetical protein
MIEIDPFGLVFCPSVPGPALCSGAGTVKRLQEILYKLILKN